MSWGACWEPGKRGRVANRRRESRVARRFLEQQRLELPVRVSQRQPPRQPQRQQRFSGGVGGSAERFPPIVTTARCRVCQFMVKSTPGPCQEDDTIRPPCTLPVQPAPMLLHCQAQRPVAVRSGSIGWKGDGAQAAAARGDW
jgi:hypothetical protein